MFAVLGVGEGSSKTVATCWSRSNTSLGPIDQVKWENESKGSVLNERQMWDGRGAGLKVFQ